MKSKRETLKLPGYASIKNVWIVKYRLSMATGASGRLADDARVTHGLSHSLLGDVSVEQIHCY